MSKSSRRMGKKDSNRPAQHLKVPMAAPNMRIGLLGGSFNPAHAAHRQISLAALKRLRLDQVWWLVSPNNPLKAKAPDLETRIAVAREVAHHPKIVVTGFEAGRNSAYTVDTIRFLKRRYPVRQFRLADGRRQSRVVPSLACLGGAVPPRADRRARPPGLSAEGAGEPGRAALCLCGARRNRCSGTSRHGTAGLDAPHFAALQPLVDAAPRCQVGDAARVTPRKAAKAAKKEVKKGLKAAKRRVKKDAKQAKRDAKATKKSKKKA